MSTALITGASAGLGFALASALAREGWHLIVDARGNDRLEAATTSLQRSGTIHSIAGSVRDPAHRGALVDAVRQNGRLDLLVNNASELGGSPQPALIDLTEDIFDALFQTNAGAPVQLMRALVGALADSGGCVVNISSDAAVEHYAGWGSYGASKAALDHLTATFAIENPEVPCYCVDPGDMRTDMHQAAFPGEDISDRPDPASVVPAILALIDRRPPSGRVRAQDVRHDLGSEVEATP